MKHKYLVALVASEPVNSEAQQQVTRTIFFLQYIILGIIKATTETCYVSAS